MILRLMKVQPGNVLNALNLLEDLYDLRSGPLVNTGLLIRVSNLEADTNGLVWLSSQRPSSKIFLLKRNEKLKTL